jgi:hypothetical protein
LFSLSQDLPIDAGPSYVNCDLPEPRLSSFPPPALLPPLTSGRNPAASLPPLTLYLPPANNNNNRLAQQTPDPDTGSPSHQVPILALS